MFISGLIMTTLVALTTEALPADVQTKLSNFFTTTDADKSGKASMAEFQTMMKRIDKDNNSQISLAEYAPITPVGHKLMVPMFKYLDKNKNGYLDNSDFKAIFQQYDVNLDGEVSRQEAMVQYEAIFTLIEAEVVMVTPKTVG